MAVVVGCHYDILKSSPSHFDDSVKVHASSTGVCGNIVELKPTAYIVQGHIVGPLQRHPQGVQATASYKQANE